MKVVFRTDASIHIGSGHVMRCLTLAQALRQQGIVSHFLCADLSGHLAQEIQARGFGCTLISGYLCEQIETTWPEVVQKQHAHACLDIFDSMPTWFIVDHYGLDWHFEALFQQKNIQIMVIDDLANRQHSADILLDPNYFPQGCLRYRHLVPKHCVILSGPRYALLRPEFNALRKKGLRRDGHLKKILVFLGGMDRDNITGVVLLAVKKFLQEKTVHVDIVIGKSNPHRSAIQALCRQSNQLCLHIQTAQMAQLMLGADLALGAGGSTHWERCMLGLPALVCTLAPNQQLITELLAQQGVCRYLGDGQALTAEDWYQALHVLRHNDLCSMSTAAQGILDANDGCHRVIDALITFEAMPRQGSIE